MATEDKVSEPSEKKVKMSEHTGKRKLGKSVRKFIKRWQTLITILVTLITVFVAIAGLLWGVYQFNTQQRTDNANILRQEQETQNLANEQQQETTLQTYINDMTALLFDDKLGGHAPTSAEAAVIARAKTLIVLSRLANPQR